MRSFRLKSALISVLLFVSLSSFAQSTILTLKHFASINTLINQNPNPTQTLLAMDDDDTLTMMPCDQQRCQYLGGPAWFTWQASLPAGDPRRVSNTFSGLLEINNDIFTLSEMPVVEPTIPQVLKNAQSKGMHMMVLTSRGNDMMSATLTQLTQDNILNTIDATSLQGKLGPYIPPQASRPIEYSNGVLFLAGQNKGVMLQDFLNTAPQNHIHRIIFVDDDYSNVKAVADVYAHDPAMQVTAIYYTFLEKHKADFISGKDAAYLQDVATTQWNNLKKALQENLPAFASS